MASQDNYRCLCGVHVHDFTLIIALFVVIFEILETIGWFVSVIVMPPNFFIALLHVFFNLIPAVLLLVGNLHKRSALYIPYIVAVPLILAAIALALTPLLIVGGVSSVVDTPQVKDVLEAGIVVCVIILGALWFVWFVFFYLLRIVIRGRQYLLTMETIPYHMTNVNYTQSPLITAPNP